MRRRRGVVLQAVGVVGGGVTRLRPWSDFVGYGLSDWLSTCCRLAGGEGGVSEVGGVGGGGGPSDAGAAGGVQLRPEGVFWRVSAFKISLLGAILGVDPCLEPAGGGGGEQWAGEEREDWKVVEPGTSGTSPPTSASSLSGRFIFLVLVLVLSKSVVLLRFAGVATSGSFLTPPSLEATPTPRWCWC